MTQTKYSPINPGRFTLHYTGLETLSLVGANITVPSGTDRAIELSGYQHKGFLSMVDSQIVFESQSNFEDRVAVYPTVGSAYDKGVYMRDVYVKNATDITINVLGEYPGNSDGWFHVNEYTTANFGYDAFSLVKDKYESPTWIDGTRQTTSLQDEMLDETPPSDLQSRHKWDESTFPYWDRPGAVNIKLSPYNAKGDFETDDTAVIQAAIDDGNEVIFFPKGYYRVSKTLKLQPNTKLIGAGGHTSSVIIACNGLGSTKVNCVAGDNPNSDFNDAAGTPLPVIESYDDANGTATMAFIGVHTPIQVHDAYQLLWQTGRHSLFRMFHMWQKNIIGSDDYGSSPDNPNIIFKNNGGGRWYSYFNDFWWTDTWEKAGHESFRHVKIDGTREPIRFYQFNPESQNDAQFTELEINDAHNVNIYGFKDEGIARAALIKDSENINIYGGAGLAYLSDKTPSEVPGDPPVMYEIIDSNNIRLTSMLSRGLSSSSNADHDDYSWIRETYYGVTTKTDKFTDTGHHDRPMLYKRGAGGVDILSPDVTVDQAASQADPTTTDSATFTAFFSEAVNVSTFAEEDITLTGTTGSVMSDPTEVAPNNGTTFEFTVTGMTDGDTVTATIPAGGVEDLAVAANTNNASTSTDNQVTYDTTPPQLNSVVRNNGASKTLTGTLAEFRVTFSEPVQNVDTGGFGGDFTGAAAGTVSNVTLVSSSTYVVMMSGITGNNRDTVGITLESSSDEPIKDQAGNSVLPVTSTSGFETYTIKKSGKPN